MTHCSNCGRRVRNPILAGGFALGPVCARKVGAVLARPRARSMRMERAHRVEDGQGDLFT